MSENAVDLAIYLMFFLSKHRLTNVTDLFKCLTLFNVLATAKPVNSTSAEHNQSWANLITVIN